MRQQDTNRQRPTRRRGGGRRSTPEWAPKPLVFRPFAASIGGATGAARGLAVAIHSHEGAPFRHSLILPIFVENEPRPTGHYTVR